MYVDHEEDRKLSIGALSASHPILTGDNGDERGISSYPLKRADHVEKDGGDQRWEPHRRKTKVEFFMAKLTSCCTPNAPLTYHSAVTTRASRRIDARIESLVKSGAPYSAVESVELNRIAAIALSG